MTIFAPGTPEWGAQRDAERLAQQAAQQAASARRCEEERQQQWHAAQLRERQRLQEREAAEVREQQQQQQQRQKRERDAARVKEIEKQQERDAEKLLRDQRQRQEHQERTYLSESGDIVKIKPLNQDNGNEVFAVIFFIGLALVTIACQIIYMIRDECLIFASGLAVIGGICKATAEFRLIRRNKIIVTSMMAMALIVLLFVDIMVGNSNNHEGRVVSQFWRNRQFIVSIILAILANYLALRDYFLNKINRSTAAKILSIVLIGVGLYSCDVFFNQDDISVTAKLSQADVGQNAEINIDRFDLKKYPCKFCDSGVTVYKGEEVKIVGRDKDGWVEVLCHRLFKNYDEFIEVKYLTIVQRPKDAR